MKTKVLLFFLLLPVLAVAQTYTLSTLAQWPPTTGSLSSPLIIDSTGNMYDTRCCPSNGFGNVLKVTPKGVVTTLYTFRGGKDGGIPSGLTRDSLGNLYGITSVGGAHGSGTVFKVTPSKKETTLYNFINSNHPRGVLLRDSGGNLYGYLNVGTTGTTEKIFDLTPKGVFSTLYTFCSQTNCIDGSDPVGNPIMDKAGNFYGMTQLGGTFGYGVVFKMTPAHTYSVLYSFTGGVDGANPTGRLAQNAAGLMYGTTMYGGQSGLLGDCLGGCGTVFQITAAGAFTMLYSFTDNGTDGYYPQDPVALDSAGNLYGVTVDNTGNDYNPTLFQLSPLGVLTWLPCPSAMEPGLVLDKSGNIFGTTKDLYYDGPGTSIFKLTKQ